jgi:mono/diheme cytochrome c family protein
VRDILVYGRPGTPMPAWGAEGGGPLTTQQIDELIAYLQSIQISSDEAKEEVETILREALELGEDEEINYRDPAVGEALFTLGLDTGAAGGAYSCARCHTKGASLVDGSEQPAGADLSDFKGFAHGSGAFGFSLTSGIIPRQFLSLEELVEFITKGSEYGMLYGQRGQGTGRMPGFGDNPNTEDAEDDGMFTDGMLRAVARYEANLEGEDAVEPGQETGDVTTTTTAIPGAGATSSTTSTTQQES